MNPHQFEECNVVFGPPPSLDEQQCMRIHAYHGPIKGGSLDGAPVTVTAWMPTPEELAMLNQGKPLFLSFIGGLPPHFPSTSFEQAVNPA